MKKLLIFLVLLSGILPNFYAADRYSTQYLYLSGILLIYYVWSLFQENHINPFRNKILVLYIIFFIISIITLSVSFNLTESIIVLGRILAWILIGTLFLNILKDDSRLIIFTVHIISLFCLVESFSIFYGFLQRFSLETEFGRSAVNKGLASNINIAAFSIVNKIPFLIYSFITLLRKNKFILILTPLLVIPFFSISITGSRGALLTVYVIAFLILITIAFNYFLKLNYKKYLKKFIIIFFGSFLISAIATELVFDSLSVSYRTGQIIERGSQSRIRFYKETFDVFKKNPFLGIGIGNWKIYSVKEDSQFIDGYVVPYHSHNDFLQIAAETGVFGFLAYFSFFISIAVYSIKGFVYRNSFIYLICLMYVITYIIDSSLNFPMTRPINNVVLFAVVAILSNSYFKKTIEWDCTSF